MRRVRWHALRRALVVWLAVCLAAPSLASCRRESPGTSELPQSSAAAAFNGTWVREGAELWLWAFDDERLRVRFRGQHEYRSDSGPMVNLGEADGWASVHGNDARVIVGGFEDDCRITMRLVSDALEVAEEGHCGFGLNVTAAGTYRRASTDRPAFGAPAPALPPLPDARQRPSA